MFHPLSLVLSDTGENLSHSLFLSYTGESIPPLSFYLILGKVYPPLSFYLILGKVYPPPFLSYTGESIPPLSFYLMLGKMYPSPSLSILCWGKCTPPPLFLSYTGESIPPPLSFYLMLGKMYSSPSLSILCWEKHTTSLSFCLLLGKKCTQANKPDPFHYQLNHFFFKSRQTLFDSALFSQKYVRHISTAKRAGLTLLRNVRSVGFLVFCFRTRLFWKRPVLRLQPLNGVITRSRACKNWIQAIKLHVIIFVAVCCCCCLFFITCFVSLHHKLTDHL